MKSRAVYLFAIFGLFLSAAPALAQGSTLALTPPMGWNSWNKFGFRQVQNAMYRILNNARDSL
jgi:hypothetical protein